MRVAIVSNFFTPMQTGSCYWAEDLARAHVAAGDEVIVVTVGANKEIVEEQGEGFTIYRLPAKFRLPKLDFFMNFDSFLLMDSRANRRHLETLLRRHRIEVVHQSNQLLDCIFLVDTVCRRLGLPWLCTVHGALRHDGNRLYSAIMQFVDRTYIRRTIDRAEAVVGLDKGMVAYVEATYRAKRRQIVPLAGMNRAYAEQLPHADPARSDGSGVLRVASVGHITENRNRTDLVHAARLLKDRGVGVHFEIVGRELSTRARTLAAELDVEDCFTFHGELQRSVLLKLMSEVHAEAHLFFMPALGIATLEAMAVGLPTVCYAYEGIYGDMPLKHGENIYFADRHDPATIADCLCELADDPEKRARVGANARAFVLEYLTWDTVVEQYRQLYREVLSSYSNS